MRRTCAEGNIVPVCSVLFVLICCVFAQEKFTLSTSVEIEAPSSVIKPTTSPNSISTTKIPYQKLSCPKNANIPLFSLPCYTNKDCKVFGPGLACCKERCIKGILVPVQDQSSRKARLSNAIENSAKLTNSIDEKAKQAVSPVQTKVPKKPELVCPRDARAPLFPLRCIDDEDCTVFSKALKCCNKICLEGVQQHSPSKILFGLVERVCSNEPLAEIWDIKECEKDSDCTPRICCAEKRGKGKKYCRTPMHIIDNIPGSRRIEQPLRNIVEYMQCQAQPKFELYSRECKSTLDCFPNLCCQENGRKVCRAPKKSILSVVAGVATRIGATQAIKTGIERITR